MSITFNDLCYLLEGVEKISTRKPRLPREKENNVIKNNIAKWFDNHRRAIDSLDTNGGAILSAILPHRRKDRVYGLQPPLLSKKITKLLKFNHGQLALFNKYSSGSNGDLGKSTELSMRPWDGTFKSKRLISIDRVDRLLTQLAAKYRFSDPTIRQQRDWHMNTDNELTYILVRLESWEAKWLVRLLLREYPTIDFDEAYVFKQYHFLLPDLLKFQNDFDAAFSMLRGELRMYPSVPEASLQRSMRIEASKRLKAVVGVKIGRPTFYKAWSFKHCFQLVGNQAWAAEVKYDGEYCEIHVDLDKAPNDIKIFSKNGKDATADRELLQSAIRDALRIGQQDCQFKRTCIILGEMVLYSDKEKKILPFFKIRKHISRSGVLLGTLQDSIPHEWEHLMLVIFDVLMLDDEPVMRKGLQSRRLILRDLVRIIPGRCQRSEWTLLDFKTEDGETDLKQAFAHALANRQEGLVLKPLHAPYFPLLTEIGQRQPGFLIKLKKDYLNDMGGQRDLGDFAVIGACFDAQVAPKTDLKPLRWTHFHLGCVINKNDVQHSRAKPKFKVVACLSLDKCIPKHELKYLNNFGQFQAVRLRGDGSIDAFDIDQSYNYDLRMTVAFKNPFVAEILGGGYERVQNETFEMLRHPRITKIHHDRTWEDTVTMDDLKRMAKEKWEPPDADKLSSHARDVAIMVEKYVKELGHSQFSASEYETTQETTQCSTQLTHESAAQCTQSDAIFQEAQLTDIPNVFSPTSTIQSSSTQGKGECDSGKSRILVREDTSERLAASVGQSLIQTAVVVPQTSTLATEIPLPCKKRNSINKIISPPVSKRRRIARSPLRVTGENRKLGVLDYDSQERTIHIYAQRGWKVLVHTEPQMDE